MADKSAAGRVEGISGGGAERALDVSNGTIRIKAARTIIRRILIAAVADANMDGPEHT